MSQVLFSALTTPQLTDLDANFTQLYSLRELISTPTYTAATPKAAIDSSGNLVVGGTSPLTTRFSTLSLTPRLGSVGSGAGTCSLGAYRFSADSSAPGIYLAKSRAATADFTAVNSGDLLGAISFAGADGVQMTEGARITAVVRGAVAADTMPTGLDFYVNPGTGTTPAIAMRLDQTGALYLGTTAAWSANAAIANINYAGGGSNFGLTLNTAGTTGTALSFCQGGASTGGTTTKVGSVTITTSATTYNTSSDYRLKDNIADVANSGAFIDALRPRTWNWKVDGSTGTGFIAHELQAVSPTSVDGAKDAVDAEGKPMYQGVEYGSAEVVAMMVAELKDLRRRVAALGG